MTSFPLEAKAQVRRIIEMASADGCPVHRFVDDIGINWAEIAGELDRTEDECKFRVQQYMDSLFELGEFSPRDREVLVVMIVTETLTDVISQMSPHDIALYLQEKYFTDYSTMVVYREYMALQDAITRYKRLPSISATLQPREPQPSEEKEEREEEEEREEREEIPQVKVERVGD
ncbi:hypothetical protein GMRT_12300 [Giardia muris]|uniref:Uncharacterized protein n=1 Tax=Giardia muris TaxID=5742 RepID=A0A4Z1T8T9_GIAMU|nr:hypothetical protein GMRT_12300 [Giardia muris]|eukprot:TNJ30543.1 hypothetical protein GMRT_12300 [Giardia muris]